MAGSAGSAFWKVDITPSACHRSTNTALAFCDVYAKAAVSSFVGCLFQCGCWYCHCVILQWWQLQVLKAILLEHY
jgi:hypothetical protein